MEGTQRNARHERYERCELYARNADTDTTRAMHVCVWEYVRDMRICACAARGR